MEPLPPMEVSTFIRQAQNLMNKETVSRENFNKLSKSQLSLAIKVIENTDNIRATHDPVMQRELTKIIEILHGAKEVKTGSLFQSIVQSKSKKAESKIEKERQIGNLVNVLAKSTAAQNKIHLFEEKTTGTLLKNMRGEELQDDKAIAAQLNRDLKGGLAKEGQVKIGNKDVNMPKPTNTAPLHWETLIPKEIKDFVGEGFETMGSTIALVLTQGIGADAYIKGVEVLKDPLFPDAKFSVDGYPKFNFKKVDGNMILEVTTTGSVKDTDMETGKKTALKSYEIVQLVNLSDPDAMVKMIIAPKK